MYKRILLAYDGSQSGQKALLECGEVAGLSNAETFLIAVAPPAAALIGGEGYVYDARAEEEERNAFQRVLDDGIAQLRQAGRRVVQGEGVGGQPVDEITEYANRVKADLIVVGHRHLDSWAARW